MNKEEKGTVLEPMRERWNAVLLAIVNSPWSASQKLDYLRDVLAPGYVAAQQRAETPPEPVAWQVRWTNPGNNPASRDEESMWKPVEPDWRIDQTMEQKVAELRSYRYEGKPCYEVRALYATSPERAETPPDERDAQIERLKIRGEAYENAYRIALAATYQSHTGHWDKTGGSGSGCPECIRASEARENCDAAIREGLEKLAARALATPPERAETPEPKIVCWWNGLAEEDERDLTGPSYSQKEDTWHDIPLVAISNPCNERAETPQASPEKVYGPFEGADATIAALQASPDLRTGGYVSHDQAFKNAAQASPAPTDPTLTCTEIDEWIETIATYSICGWRMDDRKQMHRFARAIERAQAKGAAQPDPAVVSFGLGMAPASVHSTERDGEAVQRPVGIGPWVSVEEGGYPEPETECLVWVDKQDKWGPHPYLTKWSVQREDPTGMGGPTIETGYGWDDFYEGEVTHWIPLPPAPTEPSTRSEHD